MVFRSNLKALRDLYPPGENLIKEQRALSAAGAIYHLVQTPMEFDKDKQAAIGKHLLLVALKLPEIDGTCEGPTWGPLKTEEWSEPCNRATQAIKCFNAIIDEIKAPGWMYKQTDLDTDENEQLVAAMRESLADDEPVVMLETKKVGFYWAEP
ncbi:MAG: hypothetical protein Q9169_003664 [Polycauliona sp. 2 TL-2023]